MALRLVAAAHSDPGLQREQNEDASHTQMGTDPARVSGLFIVADGMGGYHAGEVASQLAVETIRDDLAPLLGPTANQPTIRLGKRRKGKDKDNKDNKANTQSHDSKDSKEGKDGNEASEGGALTQVLSESLAMEHYGERLREAVEHSSQVIYKYGREHRDASGLGSTLTAVLVVEAHAYIANVGDSRTYLFREGKLQRITRDHSLVARLVESGQIGADEVYDHPHRNLIYRSLGAGTADVEVDIFAEHMQAGDTLVLCCDGLWEMVRDPEITDILTREHDLDKTAKQLVERANANGGEDNITVVLVRCEEA